jgi:hypothetical protein
LNSTFSTFSTNDQLSLQTLSPLKSASLVVKKIATAIATERAGTVQNQPVQPNAETKQKRA